MARLLVVRMRAGELTRAHVELAAYCGHEGARLVTPEEPWEFCDSPPLDTWLKGLRSTAKPLPNVQGKGERECPAPCKNGQRLHISQATGSWGMHSEHACVTCHGTGRVPYTVPASRYVMALAAVAAARVALVADAASYSRRYPASAVPGLVLFPQTRAADAAERWLREPTAEHEQAWEDAVSRVTGHDRLNVIAVRAPRQVAPSAEVQLAGVDAAREAISAALIKWALA